MRDSKTWRTFQVCVSGTLSIDSSKLTTTVTVYNVDSSGAPKSVRFTALFTDIPRSALREYAGDIEYEFEVAEEGGYTVSVPELPGCLSEGGTFEEAWDMIQDAMEGWLLVAAKHGDPIPSQFIGLVEENQNSNG